MKNKYFLLLIILLSSILFSIQGSATIITFKADGTDNIPDGFNEDPGFVLDLNDPSANFFKVTFNDGKVGEFITKIKIDLRAGSDDDAFFDPSDGQADPNINNNGGGRGFGPVVGAETIGLDLSDITFSLNATSGISPVLEIMFANGSFAANDSLSFGIDIDLLGDGLFNQAGGLLGSKSVGLTTYLSGSCEQSVNSSFTSDSRNSSESLVKICGATPPNPVPEPSILFLMLSGLGLIGFFRNLSILNVLQNQTALNGL
ncbi:MAG: PEP-CTERM sorting domain-containing protein [Betaproteobacteria bacterium]|nr:PEP-CTERM sorting domain-containing protein [Betaproteobacteria bacterium]